MAIEKSLYQAPEGLESLENPNEPAIEIEIEDPEAVNIDIDGLEISLVKGEETDEDFDEIGRAHV